jgi:hypothetical protein
MSPLENELKSAMRRRDAPDGFADRVMERVPARKGRSWPHPWFAAAAAAMIAILGSGVYEQQRAAQMRREGERAKAELVMALEIASEKLQQARAKVLKHSTEDQI